MGQETPEMTEPLTKGYFNYYLKIYCSTADEGGVLMPIYEYQCSDCSRTFEKIIWTSKGETVQCPYCKGKKVTRLLSAFSKARGQSGDGVSLPSSCGPSSSGFS